MTDITRALSMKILILKIYKLTLTNKITMNLQIAMNLRYYYDILLIIPVQKSILVPTEYKFAYIKLKH